MSSPPNDIRQIIQDLLSRSAADQLQNLRRFEEVLRRTSRSDLDSAAIREEYLRFAREESARYINDLTRVGLSFYNTLIELNRHYNDRFFEEFASADRNGNGLPATEKEPRIVDMDLHAPLGADATRTFVIDNRKAETVSISFLVSEFTDEATEKNIFRPPLQLSPARFSLDPGEERQVRLVVPLLPEFFAIGEVYAATLIASGFENLHLRLHVWADPPPDSPEEDNASGVADKPSGLVFHPVEEDSTES